MVWIRRARWCFDQRFIVKQSERESARRKLDEIKEVFAVKEGKLSRLREKDAQKSNEMDRMKRSAMETLNDVDAEMTRIEEEKYILGKRVLEQKGSIHREKMKLSDIEKMVRSKQKEMNKIQRNGMRENEEIDEEISILNRQNERYLHSVTVPQCALCILCIEVTEH